MQSSIRTGMSSRSAWFTTQCPRVVVRSVCQPARGRQQQSVRCTAEPKEARAAGRMTYRPQSYAELVADASKSVLAALEDGIKLMEVEFPAVPVNIDAYKGSSDLFIDSNIQYALSAAKQISAAGKKVHLVAPDFGEYARSYNMFKGSLELMSGVTMGHLKEKKSGDLLTGFQSLFAGNALDSAAAGKAVMIITAHCYISLALCDECKLCSLKLPHQAWL
eukprot:GHUV01034410.1.p1 GENE.GHUV01034410.1~~GHUV01034410.1.p1  ORF type:complete len:220 (+),score=38.50 GHUV01034410.1:158-817(+)